MSCCCPTRRRSTHLLDAGFERARRSPLGADPRGVRGEDAVTRRRCTRSRASRWRPGRTIIEASAGTGKTYTIAAEVTRLVALEGIELGEILVVTFTRAATAELKSRVRDRMRSTLRSAENRRPDGRLRRDLDGYSQALLAADPATKDARRTPARAGAHPLRRRPDLHHPRLRPAAARSARVPLADTAGSRTGSDRPTAADTGRQRCPRRPLRATIRSGDEEPKLSHLEQIGRAVVGTPDARIVPAADAVDGIARTRVEMAHVIEREMARRLRAGGMVTFDDGLVEARDALADADIGEGAREILQRRYAVALVDEAQDTDPIQWQIIRSVFDDARLVVVGDPKQSIYSFRSADVESYLAAVDGADEVRTLGTNWRSDGPLLTALDTLFTGATFGDDRIAYAAGRSRSRTCVCPARRAGITPRRSIDSATTSTSVAGRTATSTSTRPAKPWPVMSPRRSCGC